MSKRRIVIKGQTKPERPAPSVVQKMVPIVPVKNDDTFMRIRELNVRAETFGSDEIRMNSGRSERRIGRMEYTLSFDIVIDRDTFIRMQELSASGQLESVLERAINGSAE